MQVDLISYQTLLKHLLHFWFANRSENQIKTQIKYEECTGCKYDELKVSLIVKADSASGFWQIAFSFFRKIFIKIT